MARLTVAQRALFTNAQLVYVDNLSDVEGSTAEVDTIVRKWVTKPPLKLRAKMCLGRIVWGSGNPTITWSEQSDLTTAEKQAVADLLGSGQKYEDVVLEVLAGKRSVEQRLATLESG